MGESANVSVDTNVSNVNNTASAGEESPVYRVGCLTGLMIANSGTESEGAAERGAEEQSNTGAQASEQAEAPASPPEYDGPGATTPGVPGAENSEEQSATSAGQAPESSDPTPPDYYPRWREHENNDEEPEGLPSYPPKHIDLEMLQCRLASLVDLADKVAEGLNQHAAKVSYERYPALRRVVGEHVALHMTLENLQKAFEPTSRRYLDYWLETLDLVLNISGDPLEEVWALLSSQNEQGGASPPLPSSPKWKKLFSSLSASNYNAESSKAGAASSSTSSSTTRPRSQSQRSSEIKKSVIGSLFSGKLKQGNATEKLLEYEKRTVPYCQMLNLLYTSSLPDLSEERAVSVEASIEASVGRVLKLLKDPNGLGSNLDIRLADDVPVETIGHWVPETVMIGGVEFANGSVGIVIKKHKPRKRIFVEIIINEREDRTYRFIMSKQSTCERGVGNDPLVLHNIMRSEREDDGFEDVYIWLNTLERDSFCLSLAVVKFLKQDWFPKTSRDKKRWPQLL